MLRALNLAPSQAECEKRGQTKKTGEKAISFDEFSKIYAEFYAMPEKTWGTYDDFMEGLKLYDKDQNGKLALGELCQVLSMMCKNFQLFIFKYFRTVLKNMLNIFYSRKDANG